MSPTTKPTLCLSLLVGLIISVQTATVNLIDQCPEHCECISYETYNHTKCTSLDGLQTFDKPKTIQSLDLSNIGLTKLSKQLKKLTNLAQIDLSNNQLTEMPELNRRIKTINLSHNRITSGKLRNIPGHVKHLNLSYNDITYIPDNFRQLERLITLDLSGNQINCSCDTLEVRNWLERQLGQRLDASIVCSGPLPVKGKPWLQVRQGELCGDGHEEHDKLLDLEDNEMLGDQPASNEADDDKIETEYLPVTENNLKRDTINMNAEDDLDGSGDDSPLEITTSPRLESIAKESEMVTGTETDESITTTTTTTTTEKPETTPLPEDHTKLDAVNDKDEDFTTNATINGVTETTETPVIIETSAIDTTDTHVPDVTEKEEEEEEEEDGDDGSGSGGGGIFAIPTLSNNNETRIIADDDVFDDDDAEEEEDEHEITIATESLNIFQSHSEQEEETTTTTTTITPQTVDEPIIISKKPYTVSDDTSKESEQLAIKANSGIVDAAAAAPPSSSPPPVVDASKTANTHESQGTMILLIILGIALVALLAFLICKRKKVEGRNRRNKNDVEAPKSTELLDMDKTALGKPAKNGNGEYIPLIGDKDHGKLNGGNGITDHTAQKPNDLKDAQEPLLRKLNESETESDAPNAPESKQHIENEKPHNQSDPVDDEHLPVQKIPTTETNNNNNNNNSTPVSPVPPYKRPGMYKTPAIHNGYPSDTGDDDVFQPAAPVSPRPARYSPVYSPETGRVKIKLTETPKPRTPMLVTRTRSNAGDIILTPHRSTHPAAQTLNNSH